MAAVAAAMQIPLQRATEPGVAPRVIQVALLLYAVVVVTFAYGVAAGLLRIPEVDEIVGRAVARIPLARRRSRSALGRP